jgi:ATP/maltotriose-dependent transcriptional regulator MalT
LSFESEAEVNNAVRAKALLGAGTLARFQGDFARARMLCDQSLKLYRTLADKAGALIALVQLARISSFQGDQTSTESFLAEAASLIETLPESVVKADAYIDMVISMTGTSINQLPPEAAHYLDESERIHRALNNPTGVAFVLLHQANRALWEGDYTLAASRFDEAERLIMELGDDHLHTRLAMSRCS